MTPNFKPNWKWLSVSFRPPQTRSTGGLYLARPIYSQVATVLAVGPAVEHVKAGQTVFMHKHGDGMVTQQSLWSYYVQNMFSDPKKAAEFVAPPVVVTEDDIFGLWDDELGVLPTKKNIIAVERKVPDRTKSGIITVFRGSRSGRDNICDVTKVAPGVTEFEIGDAIFLGRYGGNYFTDIDGVEKVILATSEPLGKLIGNKKLKIKLVNERHDATAGN